jgi:hypothetical protein
MRDIGSRVCRLAIGIGIILCVVVLGLMSTSRIRVAPTTESVAPALAQACEYNGGVYSQGSLVRIDGIAMRCNNATWTRP